MEWLTTSGADVAVMLVVFAAFIMEAVVGFGSTVLTVTLGANWVPLDTLLPAFVPLNVAISTFLLIRGRAHLDLSFLLKRLLPWVAGGAVVGVVLFQLRSLKGLLAVFGVVVVVMAAVNLQATVASSGTAPNPLPRWLANALLFVGGVMHGLFGSGGPLVVFVLTREMEGKGAFRVLLSLLWLALNLGLCANYLATGLFTAETTRLSMFMAPCLILGAWIGDHVHNLVPERPFRIASQVVLIFAGGALVVRSLG